MNFERNIDPKKSLGIGRSQKRLFKNIEEIIEWGFYFPGEYSEGRVKNWFDRDSNGDFFFDFHNGIFSNTLQFENRGYSAYQSALLFFVKWFKHNVHFEDYPEHAIGLKECKTIVDGIASKIMQIYLDEFSSIQDQIFEKLKNKYNATY
jgi:hypothetical protein